MSLSISLSKCPILHYSSSFLFQQSTCNAKHDRAWSDPDMLHRNHRARTPGGAAGPAPTSPSSKDTARVPTEVQAASVGSPACQQQRLYRVREWLSSAHPCAELP